MYEHRDDIQPGAPRTDGPPPDRVQRLLTWGLVAAVVITLIAAIPGILLGGGGTTKRLSTAAPTASTTTTPGPDVQAGLTVPFLPVTSTTARKGVVTPVVGPTQPATTSTTRTTVQSACRNSYDPKCGPFRWDPDPGPNKPLTVGVTAEPQQVAAHQTVNFHVIADDPDAKIDECVFIEWGDGQTSPPCPDTAPCPTPYGPWTPPAKMPDHKDQHFSHPYDTPRSDPPYIASFHYRSRSFCNPDPYGGAATGSASVKVTP